MMTLEDARNKSDAEWYRELFKSYELRRLPETEVAQIIKGSMKAAETLWAEVCESYREYGPASLLEHYGVRIIEQENNQASNLLAYYDKDLNVLQLQTASLKAFQKHIADAGYGSLLSLEEAREMVLSHELYHVLEMNGDNVYTYRKLLKRKFLGFTRSVRLVSASEIGAYHFTKLAMGFDFPPQFLEEI